MGSLLLAGAVKGAGEGIAENAQLEQKMEAQKAMADYEQQRQMGLERMRNENAQAIESKRAQSQLGVAQLQEQWHTADVQQETEAKAAEGSKQREFLGKQGEANRQNRKDIAQIRASAQVESRQGAAKAPKTWSYRNITMPGSMGVDPVTKQPTIIPGKQFSVLQHRDGRQFVQVGDKFLPYDASKDQVPDGGDVARAASSEVDKLVAHPEQADNFLATYHYLPMKWFSASQQKVDQTPPPAGWGRNVVPAGAKMSGPAYLMGAGGGDEDESAADSAADEQDAQSTQGISGNGYSAQ